jgi:hypothetical protein
MSSSLGGYNVSKDCTISIVLVGKSFTMPEFTSFTIKAKTPDKEILPVNGDPGTIVFMGRYEGNFQGERKDAIMDDLWNMLEADYFNQIGVPPVYIDVTTRETDGSITTEKYTNVQFANFDPGPKKGQDSVTWSIDIFASRRLVSH